MSGSSESEDDLAHPNLHADSMEEWASGSGYENGTGTVTLGEVKSTSVAMTSCQGEVEGAGPSNRQEKTTEAAAEEDYKAFLAANESEVRSLGQIQKFEEMLPHLKARPQLNSGHTFRCLAGICAEHVWEDRSEAARGVAKAGVVVRQVVSLAEKSPASFQDSADCVLRTLLLAEGRLTDATHDERTKMAAEAFARQIESDADELIREVGGEVERQRSGASNASAEPTLDQLPPSLRDAIRHRDVIKLSRAVGAMSAEDADRHMKACVDAGLWVPDTEVDEAVDPETGLISRGQDSIIQGDSEQDDDELKAVERKIEDALREYLAAEGIEEEIVPARKTIEPREDEK